MGRKKNNRPKASNLTQEEVLQMLAEQQLNKPKPEPEEVRLSGEISDEINNKVRGIMTNLQLLRGFYGDVANENAAQEEVEHQGFLAENREKVDHFLSLDPMKIYNRLLPIVKKRDALYDKLIKDGVVTSAELTVFSDKAYLAYIEDLNNRRTGNDRLDIDELTTLKNARHDNLDAILNQLETAGRITAAEKAKLKSFGPLPPAQLQAARENFYQKVQAHDQANNTKYFTQYMQLHRAELSILDEFDSYAEQYNQITAGVIKDINEYMEKADQQALFREKMYTLRQQTGLDLEKGLILYAEDSTKSLISGAAPKHDVKVEITDITSGGAVQIDPDLPPKPENLQPSLDPVIHFTTEVGGKKFQLSLSGENFYQWIILNNAQEKIDDLQTLEQKLNLPPDILKVGQKLGYPIPLKYDEKDAEQQFSSTEIVKIENGQVHFSSPIHLPTYTNNRGHIHTSAKNSCSFAEFAKWYRMNQVVPENLELAKIDQCLATHHRILLKALNLPADSGSPISLVGGPYPLYLKSAFHRDDPAVVVESATDKEVKLRGGKTITPAQFLRLAKTEGLLHPTREQLDELIKTAQAKDEKGKAEAIKADAGKFELAKSKDTQKDSKGPAEHKRSYWGDYWENTKILNLLDLYKILIETPLGRMSEKFKDNAERRVFATQKDFYKGLPNFLGLNDLAGKAEDKHNGKIGEDVKNKLDYFEKNLSDEQVFEQLYGTSKPVVYKAALQFLTKKGLVRWEEDEKLMSVTNKLFPYAKYPPKFRDALGERLVRVGDKEALSEDKNLNIFEQYRAIIDDKWGTGTFDGFERANESAYVSRRDYTKNNMHNFEFLGGRIGNTLKKMVYDFEHGKDIDPAEFEGLLMGAVSGFEVTTEQALMLFISAFGMKRPKDGKTILTYSRMRHFWPAWKDQIVWLYFNLNYPKLGPDGKPVKVYNQLTRTHDEVKDKIRMEDFARFYEHIVKRDVDEQLKKNNDKDTMDKYTAGKHCIAWIQGTILNEDKVVTTMGNKGAGNLPVDMFHYVAPKYTTTDQIDSIVNQGYGGIRNILAIKNTYAGYNNQMLLLSREIGVTHDKGRRKMLSSNLANMLYCYIYFNNALRGKIGQKNQYMQVTDSVLDSKGSADSGRMVREFYNELGDFSREYCISIAKAARREDLVTLAKDILKKDDQTKVSDELEQYFRENIKKEINNLANTNPTELARITLEASGNLKGMSGATLSKEEREELERKESMAA